MTARLSRAQLLQLGVLAAAARSRGRRRSVPARRSRARARAVARARARAAARDARPGARAGAARPRDDRDGRLRLVPPRAHRVRHRGDDVGARVSPRAARSHRARARRCSRSTVTVRARRASAALLDEEHDEGAPYAHVLASEGYVVLAPDLRGFGERADWMPDDKYHCDWDLVCATMAGVVPHAAQPVGSATLARRARRASARRPRRASGAAGSRTARRARCSSPRSTSASAPRSSRATSRRGVSAHTDPVEHVRLADPARPDRRARAPRRRVADRAAGAARRERDRRHHLPGRRRARDRRRRCDRSTRSSARPTTRSCTTCSTAATCGTAPRRRPSWRRWL